MVSEQKWCKKMFKKIISSIILVCFSSNLIYPQRIWEFSLRPPALTEIGSKSPIQKKIILQVLPLNSKQQNAIAQTFSFRLGASIFFSVAGFLIGIAIHENAHLYFENLLTTNTCHISYNIYNFYVGHLYSLYNSNFYSGDPLAWVSCVSEIVHLSEWTERVSKVIVYQDGGIMTIYENIDPSAKLEYTELGLLLGWKWTNIFISAAGPIIENVFALVIFAFTQRLNKSYGFLRLLFGFFSLSALFHMASYFLSGRGDFENLQNMGIPLLSLAPFFLLPVIFVGMKTRQNYIAYKHSKFAHQNFSSPSPLATDKLPSLSTYSIIFQSL